MSAFEDFYRDKRVLVTGHTGFKGGWLVTWLTMLGARVTGFALPPNTRPNLFDAAMLDRNLQSVFGDLRDRAALTAVFTQHQPEIVFHNAAQPLVRRSYREPVETFAINVMGTVHVLEEARYARSLHAMIVVTSDKCYEDSESSRGYREDDAMGGHDPYSSSKGCAELATAAYRRSFYNQHGSAGVATARAGNVIGGGDWSEDRLVPDIVRGITEEQTIVIRRPDAVRPWQHVLEPLCGYLLLAKRLWEDRQGYAEAWNFGPREKDAIPVGELAKKVTALWGKGALAFQPDPAAPHETQSLKLNTMKARSRLGWKPALRLEQALEWSVEWYRAYYEQPQSARNLTEKQIESYMRISGA